MKKYLSVALILSVISFFSLSAQGADSVLGLYEVKGGKAHVEIYKCSDKFCGKIVWLAEPLNKAGKPKVDGNNPVESLRTREIMGMNMLWGFNHASGTSYENGKIYDPEDGKTYSCMMTLKGNDLHVRGYIGFSLIGQTSVWKKLK